MGKQTQTERGVSMKVTKLVSIPDQEIDVEVSAEDIACAIAEDTDREHTCTIGIGNALRFLMAVPDAMLDQFSDGKRATIYERIMEQAGRYLPKKGA